jgi:hypothetical protein
MKIAILSGVMIAGTPVFPTVKVSGKETATVVDVSKKDAKHLILAKFAKLVDQATPVTLELKAPVSSAEEAALDAFFGDEADSDDDDDEKE